MECQQCMKCGRELKAGEVFCETCRDEMEKYPVKPGVVVLLPHRTTNAPKPPKRHRHHQISIEEQLVKLKKWVSGLWVALILTLTAAGWLGWLQIQDWVEEQAERFLPGQNYSSEQSGSTETTE